MSKNIKINSHKAKIYFSEKKDIKKNITIHSINDNEMDKIIIILNNIFKELNIGSLDGLKYGYNKNYDKDLYKLCDWYEMPTFMINENITKAPFIILELYDVSDNFYKLINEKLLEIKITKLTNYLWYPERPKSYSDKLKNMYITENKIIPKYPIYIISKGRSEYRHTSKYLEYCKIDYKIVIEPQEELLYLKYIHKSKILILPKEYLNLNQGGIPARNYVWQHSKDLGFKRHWILDDNIAGYNRLDDSQRTRIKTGAIFKIIEDYVDRYNNIAIAGHNYNKFAISSNTNLKPIIKNTRIYSSILLSNELSSEIKWRGKYNEDTDLSLRVLKLGYATILFNNILADKLTTLKIKGGNTDTIYAEENGLLKKAESLLEFHSDVTKIKKRFNRIHHIVDYNTFKNNDPKLKENITLKKTVNNYNMILVKKDII